MTLVFAFQGESGTRGPPGPSGSPVSPLCFLFFFYHHRLFSLYSSCNRQIVSPFFSNQGQPGPQGPHGDVGDPGHLVNSVVKLHMHIYL